MPACLLAGEGKAHLGAPAPTSQPLLLTEHFLHRQSAQNEPQSPCRSRKGTGEPVDQGEGVSNALAPLAQRAPRAIADTATGSRWRRTELPPRRKLLKARRVRVKASRAPLQNRNSARLEQCFPLHSRSIGTRLVLKIQLATFSQFRFISSPPGQSCHFSLAILP
jgi:hypothetical protein